jgi:soluble lytic murein transglycosylase
MIRFSGKQRVLLIAVGLVVLVGASLPMFMSASCFSRSQTQSEIKAITNLRAMTRGGVLPSESVVAQIEADFPRSKAAALARIVRARIKLAANDFAGAASLLDTDLIKQHTSIGDYALFMRADALEKAGKAAEARIVYEQLARDYPSSAQARTATLRAADIMLKSGNAAAVPLALKGLISADDPTALFLAARAAEQAGDNTRAIGFYRRLYFYAPAATESADAALALTRLGASTTSANAEEGSTRANKLFIAKKFADAYQSYADTASRFPSAGDPQFHLNRGIAALSARKLPEAIAALSSIPTSAGEVRAEALSLLAQAYARNRQWDLAKSTLEELKQQFSASVHAPRGFAAVGRIADEAKNAADASFILRSGINSFKGSGDLAQAQFDLAWDAHEAKNYRDSSQLLTEHLAFYVDKNNDNRGRAGYWAARDSERAGKLAEARALYEALLVRYDANWYGYLGKQRLDSLGSRAPKQSFAADSLIGQAVANLKTVTVAEETAGASVETNINKSDELTNVGLEDFALAELNEASNQYPNSPKVNLAIAKVYRAQEENVRAFNALKNSFPDYSQMKPEELTREEWDVFYPLAYWDIIVQESRARNLDPYQVAGLIRQETVFMTKARSAAKAYGLMQVLVPTAALTARRYGVQRTITAEALFEPRLNIQLGTAYLRDQIDKFGRIEYVAAAYNAGPGRAVAWRTSLPAEMDEWAEAVPFRETRLYVQGVVRNRLQYERLYDKDGNFRAEVGSRAITKAQGGAGVDSTVRKRRVVDEAHEE